MSQKLIKSSLILFMGSMIGNIGSAFFHLLLGRVLSATEYGKMAALVSIYLILSVPLSALQSAFAKIFAKHSECDSSVKKIAEKSFSYLNRFGWIVALLFGLSAFVWKGFLQLDSYLGLWFLALTLIFMMPLSGLRGMMQGLMDFNDLSVSMAVEGVAKLTMALGLGLAFAKADWAILSLTIGLAIPYILAVRYYGKFSKVKEDECMPEDVNKKSVIYESIRMMIGALGITFFISADVILAKHYLPEHEAGIYAAVSTLGKIVFFAPSSLASVLFPYTAKEKNQLVRFGLLKKALLAAIAVSLPVVIFYFMIPDRIFNLVFHNEYGSVGIYLGLGGISMLLICLSQIIMNYLLSQKGWFFSAMVVLSIVWQLFVIICYHDGFTGIVQSNLIAACGLFIFCSIALVKQEKLF